MKKYKRVIEVTKENLWEVINVPIVRTLEKTEGLFGEEGYDERYKSVVGYKVDIWGYDVPFALGSFLALDVCDNWHAFTEEEWEKHKNDEIATD